MRFGDDFDPGDPYSPLRGLLRQELSRCIPPTDRRDFVDPGFSAPNHSGSTKVIDGTWQQLLRIEKRDSTDAAMQGMASVHVYAEDIARTAVPGNTNSRLVLRATYQSGNGGGGGGERPLLIDATQGTTFTVGGWSAVDVDARLESAVEGQPLSIFATKKVDATVFWKTSLNPVKALWALPSFLVDPVVVPVPILRRIPQQARSMMVVSTNATTATLTAHFSTDSVITSVRYRRLDPGLVMSPIVNGVEFFSLSSPDSQVVTPVFELVI